LPGAGSQAALVPFWRQIPVAASETFNRPAGSLFTIRIADVLANDFDPAGDTLTITA